MCSICTAVRNAIHGRGQTANSINPINPTILSIEQEKTLLAASDSMPNGLDLRDVVTIILGTGIRQAELRQLRWTDVDIKAGELHVGSRCVPLPNDVVTALTIRASKPCTEYVMGRHPDAAMMKVAHDLKAAANGIGLSGLRLHDLRYTFVVRCMASGMSPVTVGKLCGYSTAGLTTIGHWITETNTSSEARKDLKVTN
jgi:integrase